MILFYRFTRSVKLLPLFPQFNKVQSLRFYKTLILFSLKLNSFYPWFIFLVAQLGNSSTNNENVIRHFGISSFRFLFLSRYQPKKHFYIFSQNRKNKFIKKGKNSPLGIWSDGILSVDTAAKKRFYKNVDKTNKSNKI